MRLYRIYAEVKQLTATFRERSPFLTFTKAVLRRLALIFCLGEGRNDSTGGTWAAIIEERVDFSGGLSATEAVDSLCSKV